MKRLQTSRGAPEFGFAPQAFNLAGEVGEDPARLAREAAETERRQREAHEYEKRMQRLFTQCPGFVGADLPSGSGRPGRVVVAPALVAEAGAWLKKRFRVSFNAELSPDCAGVCFEIVTKAAPGSPKRKIIPGQKPVQFELSL